jgi:hypothetical protein
MCLNEKSQLFQTFTIFELENHIKLNFGDFDGKKAQKFYS